MNVAVRTVVGVDGTLVVLGAWCPKCEQEALPHDRHGTCLFCDTVIYGDAGAPPKPPSARTTSRHSRRPIPHADIVVALQAKAAELGHVPSSDEWMRFGVRPHVRTIFRRFGSWDAALIAAGLGEAA